LGKLEKQQVVQASSGENVTQAKEEPHHKKFGELFSSPKPHHRHPLNNHRHNRNEGRIQGED
jgi:hypothetical protein